MSFEPRMNIFWIIMCSFFLKETETLSRITHFRKKFKCWSTYSPSFHPSFLLCQLSLHPLLIFITVFFFFFLQWSIWLQHISILWPFLSQPAPPSSLWTPPTLTSSSYVSANRECARCWNKLNCGGGGTGEGERAANAIHTFRALEVQAPTAASAALRAPCVRPRARLSNKEQQWVRGQHLSRLLTCGWSLGPRTFTDFLSSRCV